MDKPNNAIRIPTSLNGKFFRYWFEFLGPFHKLTDREIDVLTCFVKHRYNLSKVITDVEILDKVTLGEDTKKKVIAECGISFTHLQVVLHKLRKTKIIDGTRFNPKFIPNIKKDSNAFTLLLYFDINDLQGDNK